MYGKDKAELILKVSVNLNSTKNQLPNDYCLNLTPTGNVFKIC